METTQDFEPLTQLLDLALEYANNTWNETAYYLLVAAGKLAFTDRLLWQVINTARFLGTNAYFIEILNVGGVDKYPADFIALADELVRDGLQQALFAKSIPAPSESTALPTLEEIIVFADEHTEERARYAAARQEAIACRNRRARDDT